MTVNTFKKLCLKSCTRKADESCQLGIHTSLLCNYAILMKMYKNIFNCKVRLKLDLEITLL
jgi:hypothetical protein